MDKWLETKELPYHFIAASGLVSRDDKVLLIKTPRRGWEFPGGLAEPGEGLLDTLSREIAEETGVSAKPHTLVGVYQVLDSRPGYGALEGMTLPPVTCFTFLCDYIGGEPRICENNLDVGWFTREQAREMITAPTYVKRLADMLGYKGGVHFTECMRNAGDPVILSDIIL